MPADRHQHALKLLIEHGRARGGCLYLRAGDVGLQLVAAIGIERPSHELERELLQRIERAQSLSQSLDALDEETKVFDSTPAAALIRNSMLAPSMPVTDRLSGRPEPPPRVFSSAPAPRGQPQQRVVVLTARMGGVSKPIGGAVLTLEAGASGELDPQLLHAIAEALV
ncbi:MAG TPA: hypothetical protein VFN67_34805 [Polyangiales bacterium]|nr:hypothetical protein [Polyangiales bacterium]